ncbi:MAG: hypothetical protein FJX66_08360 [Alphaproteobacteria bacterium]|nr:hypothetical protein [Alphaproteobacteria bacterium]
MVKAHRRRWGIGAVAFATLLAFLASEGTAFAKSCASDADYAALSLRVLQSDLLVAGLRCRKSAQYGEFVTRFKTELKSNGGTLKKYYSKRHGGGGRRQLDLLVTRLANDASRRAGTDTHGYCRQVPNLFDEVLKIDKGGLKQFAASRPEAGAHGITRCSSSPLKLAVSDIEPAAGKPEKKSKKKAAK